MVHYMHSCIKNCENDEGMDVHEMVVLFGILCNVSLILNMTYLHQFGMQDLARTDVQ